MRSILELFILHMVESGLSTVYDLYEKANVSIGAAHPVLRRL